MPGRSTTSRRCWSRPCDTIHRCVRCAGVAVRDTRVAGVDIAAGDLVILDIAAANHDPEVFTDPDAFDPGRSGPPSLTFGSPPRVCPGRDHAVAIAAGALDRDSRCSRSPTTAIRPR